MSESHDSGKAGTSLGFTSLLQVAFIVLKLCRAINWPWIWVLSPTWISTGLGLIIIVVIFIRLFAMGAFDEDE
jgi:membrane protein YdbS with pleckstrin-like domain